MKRPKVNLSKFVVHWFEIVRILMCILLGLVPAFVFKAYAPEGQTYDATYSLLIWAILGLMELGQIIVTAYIQTTNSNKEDNNEDKTEG